jgi:uncharacterized cupredoxin-like copper-binding protein
MNAKQHSKLIGAVAGGLFLGAVLSGPAFAAGAHGGGHNDAPKAHGQKNDDHGKKGGHGDGGHHGMNFGEAGDPKKVDRTVEVIMTDNEYNIPALTVKPGETIRFVLKNQGEFLHEFNIGMPDNHVAHQKEMMAMMESGMMTPTGMMQMSDSDHKKMGMKGMPMKHDDPNAKLVEPGKTGELIWKFKKAGSLQFACNVPGHYESGMVGEIKFPHD